MSDVEVLHVVRALEVLLDVALASRAKRLDRVHLALLHPRRLAALRAGAVGVLAHARGAARSVQHARAIRPSRCRPCDLCLNSDANPQSRLYRGRVCMS
eukprot:4335417-Pleurochrysis_carterae.AAC.3